MPKFFMPYPIPPKKAEDFYADCVKNSGTYPLAHPTARLFSIEFRDEGDVCVAAVGKEITNWRRERVGRVMAIIETVGLVDVYTRSRQGPGDSIVVGLGEVLSREYFDDFPGPP
jgi:hypothetical protein